MRSLAYMLSLLITSSALAASAPKPAPGVLTKQKMREAASILVDRMNQDNTLREQTNAIIQQQTDALKQTPCAESAAPQVRSLLEKALNPENFRTAMVNVYTNNFTLDELNWMVQFYNTPLGKKILQVQPAMYRVISTTSANNIKAAEPDIAAAINTATKDSRCQMQQKRGR